jgi:hypothetical protein
MIWTHLLIPMFACGALFATTFFLVLPEALMLIQADVAGGDDGHDHRRHLQEDDDSGETAASWRFGTAILGGFLIPIVGHIFFEYEHEDVFAHSADTPIEDGKTAGKITEREDSAADASIQIQDSGSLASS